jgi:hypothetical protein
VVFFQKKNNTAGIPANPGKPCNKSCNPAIPAILRFRLYLERLKTVLGTFLKIRHPYPRLFLNYLYTIVV